MNAHTDRVIGALIGLARATDGNEHLISPESTATIADCLAACRNELTEAEADILLQRIDAQKRKMIPDCFACAAPCGKNNAFDMAALQGEDPKTQKVKGQLLDGICEMAVGGNCKDAVKRFFYKALIVIGMGDFGPEFTESVVRQMQTI